MKGFDEFEWADLMNDEFKLTKMKGKRCELQIFDEVIKLVGDKLIKLTELKGGDEDGNN